MATCMASMGITIDVLLRLQSELFLSAGAAGHAS